MSSATATSFAPGDLIAGRYRVERVLGRGGMGVVVAAMHVDLLERRALKLMLPDAAAVAGAVERFLREARAAVRLKSEHAARVHDVGRLDDGVPFIVMEYLEGHDLSALLKKNGAFPVGAAARHVVEACDAVAEAHSLGIIHRDLKPANLFLARSSDGKGRIKVLDFGISKIVVGEGGEQPADLTLTTSMVGSPFYMSPEQIRSSKSVDARSDVWSLGVILYQLVTRKLPFTADDRFTLCLRVVQEPAKPPSSLVEGVPPELDRIVERCLAKEPDDRYASVAELARDLQPLADGVGVEVVDRMARTVVVPAPSSSATPSGATSTPLGRPTAISVPETLLRGSSTAATWGSGPAESLAPRRGRWKLLAVPIGLAIAAVAVATLRRTSDRDPEGRPATATAATAVPELSATAAPAATAPPPPTANVSPGPVATESSAASPSTSAAAVRLKPRATPPQRKGAAASAAPAAAPAAPAPAVDDPFGKDRK